MHIRVKQPGSMTTIQDRGRYGHQGQGIPVSGALDPLAMTRANLLVDNPETHPILECIGLGCVLEFDGAVCFAVCGGEFGVFLNERQIEVNRAYRAESGDVLKVTYAPASRCCCIAFSADFSLPGMYGSMSTDTRSRIGGVEGRKLKAGDVLELTGVRDRLSNMSSRRFEPYTHEDVTELRVVEGPDEEAFTAEGKNAFYSSIYTVSQKSDRMGYRLEGPSVESVKGNDILSAGIVCGAVQIAPEQVILMMQDHATTGGYAVLCALISADLPKAAQLMPGAQVRFRRVSTEEAAEALEAQREDTERQKAKFGRRGVPGFFRRKRRR